ncbi:MAG TPA: GxxExxY protein, partial [Chitinophagaceae bacterium]
MFEEELWIGELCGCEGSGIDFSRRTQRSAKNATIWEKTHGWGWRFLFLGAMKENELVSAALDIAFRLHKKYGPGLFESVYEELFCYELQKCGIPFQRQRGIPLVHESIKLEVAFRADIILDNKVILEIKSIDQLADIHFKQVLTYLKLTNLKLGV